MLSVGVEQERPLVLFDACFPPVCIGVSCAGFLIDVEMFWGDRRGLSRWPRSFEDQLEGISLGESFGLGWALAKVGVAGESREFVVGLRNGIECGVSIGKEHKKPKYPCHHEAL